MIKYTYTNKPTYIFVHHAEVRDDRIANDWNLHKKWHVEGLGWIDIGYHKGIEFIDNKIHLHDGRPADARGAHTWGFNGKSLSLLICGLFDEKEPPLIIWRFAGSIVRDWQRENMIPRSRILGHNESYAILEKRGIQLPPGLLKKSCPGKMFNMAKFRGEETLEYPYMNNCADNNLLEDYYKKSDEGGMNA